MIVDLTLLRSVNVSALFYMKPGFAIDESQTPHQCFHILLAIADQVIPQILIYSVQN